jgi:hypothetical protein
VGGLPTHTHTTSPPSGYRTVRIARKHAIMVGILSHHVTSHNESVTFIHPFPIKHAILLPTHPHTRTRRVLPWRRALNKRQNRPCPDGCCGLMMGSVRVMRDGQPPTTPHVRVHTHTDTDTALSLTHRAPLRLNVYHSSSFTYAPPPGSYLVHTHLP